MIKSAGSEFKGTAHPYNVVPLNALARSSGYPQVEPFCLHYAIKYSSFFPTSCWKSLENPTFSFYTVV